MSDDRDDINLSDAELDAIADRVADRQEAAGIDQLAQRVGMNRRQFLSALAVLGGFSHG